MRLALALWVVLAGGAEAQCRLALVVGIDVSSSVDAAEDALQRQGLARALASEPVIRAAMAVPEEPVAISVFEWSGRLQQRVIAEWRVVNGPQDMVALSETVARSERAFVNYPTAAGYALGFAATRLGEAPPCLFSTVDLSGDGISNEGFSPALAYQEFPFDGVTVNGLPITGHDTAVVSFYQDQILRGPGAFLEVAEDFEDFERAIRRKLERELLPRIVGQVSEPAGADQ